MTKFGNAVEEGVERGQPAAIGRSLILDGIGLSPVRNRQGKTLSLAYTIHVGSDAIRVREGKWFSLGYMERIR